MTMCNVRSVARRPTENYLPALQLSFQLIVLLKS